MPAARLKHGRTGCMIWHLAGPPRPRKACPLLTPAVDAIGSLAVADRGWGRPFAGPAAQAGAGAWLDRPRAANVVAEQQSSLLHTWPFCPLLILHNNPPVRWVHPESVGSG